MKVLFLFLSFILSAFNCYEAVEFYLAVLPDPIGVAQCITGTVAINFLIYYHKLGNRKYNHSRTKPFITALNVILILIYLYAATRSATIDIAYINVFKLTVVELIIITIFICIERNREN